MIRSLTLALIAVALAGAWSPVRACVFLPVQSTEGEDRTASIPPFASAADAAIGEDFPGEAILLRGGISYFLRTGPDCESNEWPWASVTKQVLATIVMQEVERGTLTLDAPAISYLPFPPSGDLASPTLRQLLQHRSGLRNPDDTPTDANGIPDFYSTGEHGLGWCLNGREPPPAEGWRYNNCDYIVIGAILERVTGRPIAALIAGRLSDAGIEGVRLATKRPRSLARSEADFPVDISRYGASAALTGPLLAMTEFDSALMEGRLLTPEAREAMWRGDPSLGYMALGQWVFDAKLEGCDEPVRIVERRGGIQSYQVRNFIAPERAIALAIAVKDEGFAFGELWQGSGKAFDILSAAICGDET